jgi:Gpi18-like mannosyltransferase
MVVFAENDCCDGLILIIRMYTNQIETTSLLCFLALSKCINPKGIAFLVFVKLWKRKA